MKKKILFLSGGVLLFTLTVLSGVVVSNNNISLTELKSSARVNCVDAQDHCYDDFQGITYFHSHDSNSDGNQLN